MLILRTCAFCPLQTFHSTFSSSSSKSLKISKSHSFPIKIPTFSSKSITNAQIKRPIKATKQYQQLEEEEGSFDDDFDDDIDEGVDDNFDDDENNGGFGESARSEARDDEEKDFDRDPEYADILSSYVDDPKKAQARVEERLRKKRNKIIQNKAGSAKPMKVLFNKFDFSNSYIWLEFYNSPLSKDITLVCDTIRSWHIIGRLGGCNCMNMQLSQSTFDKRPKYDAIQGANVTPTTFYNIGDLEVQDNLARVWVDIGTSEPLLLDILINAMIQISSDYVGIKQLAFGGLEFENWRENWTPDDVGCSIHKI